MSPIFMFRAYPSFAQESGSEMDMEYVNLFLRGMFTNKEARSYIEISGRSNMPIMGISGKENRLAKDFNQEGNESGQEGFSGEVAYRCATPIIIGALNNKEALWPENRSILYRPTDTGDPDYYGNVQVLFHDSFVGNNAGSPHFRIHYTENNINGDAPPGSDRDTNSVPEFILNVATYCEEVWEGILDMGYQIPVLDGNIGGGYNLIDVYIFELSNCCYAYTNIDADNYTYICLDDDLGISLNNLKTTIAHEFFHVIQFGYEDWFDLNRFKYMSNIWWEESTAVWIEDELYDSVNDYVNYLQYRFNKLYLPLDYSSYSVSNFEYGGVIFAKLLSEEIFDQSVILDIFERSSEINPKLAKRAIGDVISNRGKDWEEIMGQFYEKNLKRDYKDADELLSEYRLSVHEYPVPAFEESILMDYAYMSEKLEVSHLSAHYYKLIAGQEKRDLYISVCPSNINNCPVALLFADRVSNVKPSGETERIYADANIDSYHFKIDEFGGPGHYSQAYLIVFNPDPVYDHISYTWSAGFESVPCEDSLNINDWPWLYEYNLDLDNKSGCFIGSLSLHDFF